MITIESNGVNWYIAKAIVGGAIALGYGITHIEAVKDCIKDMRKITSLNNKEDNHDE